MAESFRNHIVKDVSADGRSFILFKCCDEVDILLMDDLREQFLLLFTGIRIVCEPVKRCCDDQLIEFLDSFAVLIFQRNLDGSIFAFRRSFNLDNLCVQDCRVEQLFVGSLIDGLGT